MGVLISHYQSKREVWALRQAIDNTRSTLQTIEYGAANLRLLELNPAVWEDRVCSKFLKHELAFSILDHWRDREAIDVAAGTPGYADEFARSALSFFDCNSAADFVKLAKAELWVYPDDGLLHATYELSESDLKSFDEFIRNATTPETSSGG